MATTGIVMKHPNTKSLNVAKDYSKHQETPRGKSIKQHQELTLNDVFGILALLGVVFVFSLVVFLVLNSIGQPIAGAFVFLVLLGITITAVVGTIWERL